MRIVLLGVAVWIASGPSWGQTKDQARPPQQPTTSNSKPTESQQRGSKDSPIFVHVEQDPHTQNNSTKKQKRETGKDFYDKLTAWSAAGAAVFTLGLLIIGGCGVRAAVNTLKAIKEQGDYMKRQAALMEAPLQQWIDLENWRSITLANDWLRIYVELVNPTNFPITIKNGFVRIHERGGHTKLIIGEGRIITPRRPRTLEVDFPLPEDQLASFRGNEMLTFTLDAEFTHIGPLGDKFTVIYRLSGALMCSIPKTVFVESIQANEVKQAGEDDQ